MSSCGKCNKSFGATADTTFCYGFCNNTFHYECTGMDRSTYNQVKKNSNVLWFCDKCRDIMSGLEFRKILQKLDTIASSSISASHYQHLNEEIAINRKMIEDLSANIRQLPTGSTSETPQRQTSTFLNSERKWSSVVDSSLRSKENTTAICGTKTMENTIRTIEPKYWIHISQLHPETSEDDISSMVKECLNTEDVKTIKLIPKGKVLTALEFISFKVGICGKLKEAVFQASTWPSGIFVREFRNFSSNFQQRKPRRLNSQPYNSVVQTPPVSSIH